MSNQRAPRTRITVEPVNLRQLAKRLGNATAADRIGCTDSMVSRAVADNSVTKVYEVAAKAALADLGIYESKERFELIVARVPKGEAETVCKLISAMGGKPRRFADEE